MNKFQEQLAKTLLSAHTKRRHEFESSDEALEHLMSIIMCYEDMRGLDENVFSISEVEYES